MGALPVGEYCAMAKERCVVTIVTGISLYSAAINAGKEYKESGAAYSVYDEEDMCVEETERASMEWEKHNIHHHCDDNVERSRTSDSIRE